MALLGSRMGKSASYNEILPRLYLGDIHMATNKEELARLGITDFITVETKRLQASELAQTVKNYLFFSVMDHPKQDILSHFETSNEFIETALKNPSNKVYVHCMAGISRSATLVIAYIMKTRSMNYSEAFEFVSQKRRVVDPNEGFVRQLVLYYKMKYTIDIGNLEYRRMVLDALVFEFRLSLNYYQTQGPKEASSSSSGPGRGRGSIFHMAIHAPKIAAKVNYNRNDIGVLFDRYFNKLHLQQVSKFTQVYDPDTASRCSKCRAIVFYAISVIENKLNEHSANNELEAMGSSALSRAITTKDKAKDCPAIYVEPQPWMLPYVLERDGNLECYKCKGKLGKFDWLSGESCSCPRHNSHMNFNLFKIVKKKVDLGMKPSDCLRNVYQTLS